VKPRLRDENGDGEVTLRKTDDVIEKQKLDWNA
jgi:hypothetical protein